MPASNYGAVCSLCKNPVGKGPGKRTAAQFTGVMIKLNPPKVPQLRGLVVEGEVIFCLPCLELNTNELLKQQHRALIPVKDRFKN